MNAEPMTVRQDDEVIDLDSLTDDALRQEQLTIREQLTEIRAQLKDPVREQRLGLGYPAWRQRAVFAQMHLRQEWARVLAVQRDRKIAFLEARRAAGLKSQGEQRERGRQRRLAVQDALRGCGGAEGLLLRVAVVLHHILGDQDLPESLPPESHQTLRDMSDYLIDRFGERPVSEARAGRLTATTVLDDKPADGAS